MARAQAERIAPPKLDGLDRRGTGAPVHGGRHPHGSRRASRAGRGGRHRGHLGTSVIRIGGNQIDKSFWTSSGEPQPSWADATITPADLERRRDLADRRPAGRLRRRPGLDAGAADQ